MIETKIYRDMQDAMKLHSKKVNILKYIYSEFQRRPNLTVPISDDEAMSIIRKFIKTTEESAKITNGLSEEQKFEIDVLSDYLPKQASDDEIRNWIRENIELTDDKQARMKQMGTVMKQFKNRADGNTVRQILMYM